MRKIIVTIWGIFLLATTAFGQVDTLMLVEIGSIMGPSEITHLYIEDLDGDSLKEIILTTHSNIHIYNGITYEEIWTSPELVNPTDLLFEDINNDGLTDISVRDSLNISLFDPLNSTTIWASPEIDSTYSCYTVGDRNDDDWIDVAIVSKEPFTRYLDSNNRDTVWIDIYDGPTFQEQNVFVLLLENWVLWGTDWYWQYNEIPSRADLNKISCVDGMCPVIVIFTDTFNHGNAPGGLIWTENLGNIWLIDAVSFEFFTINDIGAIMKHYILHSNGSNLLYSLTNSYSEDTWGVYSIKKTIHSFAADTLLDSRIIWETNIDDGTDWKGFYIDSIDSDYETLEITYSVKDSLYLLNFPGGETLWETSGIIDLDSLLFIFTAASMFNSPQIICQIENPPFEYRFFGGSDGALSAIMRYDGYTISDVRDIESDGNDEIFSLDANMLRIFGLQPTSLDENTAIPYRAYLIYNYPNPFNASTTIKYDLRVAGHVTIEIYDLLGRKVETLIDEKQQAGTYQIIWDAADMSSGIYFYRVQAGEYTKTKKMVLLR